MKNLGLLIVAIGITTVAISQSASPELVSSSGDSFSNTSYQLDWSIGESLTATHNAGTYVITQGFQQSSYEITAIDDLSGSGVVTVYPNPATDFITVDIGDPAGFENPQGLVLTDMNGKVLLLEKIVGSKQQLDFSTYPAGIYFLTVKQENQVIKSFKIIKN